MNMNIKEKYSLQRMHLEHTPLEHNFTPSFYICHIQSVILLACHCICVFSPTLFVGTCCVKCPTISQILYTYSSQIHSKVVMMISDACSTYSSTKKCSWCAPWEGSQTRLVYSWHAKEFQN